VTIVFTDRLSHQDRLEPTSTLSLTAEERTQISLRGYSDQGLPIALKLARGTILQEGDWLRASTGELIQVLAKKESVLTITSLSPLRSCKRLIISAVVALLWRDQYTPSYSPGQSYKTASRTSGTYHHRSYCPISTQDAYLAIICSLAIICRHLKIGNVAVPMGFDAHNGAVV